MEQNSSSLREQGIQALRRGDDDRAIDLLTRAVLVDSRDAEARSCLGITASRKGLHVRAVSALREAVALDPENPNYRYNLGVALERAGDLREARAAYEETLRKWPGHAQASRKLTAIRADGAAAAPGVAVGVPLQVNDPSSAPAAPFETSAEESEGSPGTIAVEHGPAETPVEEPLVALEGDASSLPSGGDEAGPATPDPPQVIASPSPLTAPPGSFSTDPPPAAWQQPTPGNLHGYPAGAPIGLAGAYQPPPLYGYSHLRPHRGGTVLGLGVASLVIGVLCCGLGSVPSLALAIAAWLYGNQDLAQMDAGVMDPSGRSSTQTGRVMGIVMTLLSAFMVVGFAVYMIVAFALGVSSGISGGGS